MSSFDDTNNNKENQQKSVKDKALEGHLSSLVTVDSLRVARDVLENSVSMPTPKSRREWRRVKRTVLLAKDVVTNIATTIGQVGKAKKRHCSSTNPY